MIPAVHAWPSNAHLIRDVAELGYIGDMVLDVTYGLGNFWTEFQPEYLLGTDQNAAKSMTGDSVNFTRLPFSDRGFQTVVFDPPYKLNGTPDQDTDERYGVETPTRWQDRMSLMLDGLIECCRVADRTVLAKCQDQVCSGKVRWQTLEFEQVARGQGFEQVDRFDLLGTARPQPMEGRRQRHAHGRPSTLLVFQR